MMGSEANRVAPLTDHILFNITLFGLRFPRVGSVFGRSQLVSGSPPYGLRSPLVGDRLSGVHGGVTFPLASPRWSGAEASSSRTKLSYRSQGSLTNHLHVGPIHNLGA